MLFLNIGERSGKLELFNGFCFTEFPFYFLCVIAFFELANLHSGAVSSSYICGSKICNCPLTVKVCMPECNDLFIAGHDGF